MLTFDKLLKKTNDLNFDNKNLNQSWQHKIDIKTCGIPSQEQNWEIDGYQ